MAYACRQHELGKYGSVPEIKIEWEGDFPPRPITYRRTSSMVAYAEMCIPEDLLENSWKDIVDCAQQAAIATGIATIVGSPAAAIPTFQLIFKPCITAKIGARVAEVQVALSTRQQPNEDWHR